MVGRGQVGSNLGWSLVARAETCDQCHMNLKVNAKVESCTKIKSTFNLGGQLAGRLCQMVPSRAES